jgi:hypothetical protein
MRSRKQPKQPTTTRQAAIRKPAAIRKSGVVLAVANHAAMGTALGLVFALILISTPFFGVLPLIDLSDNPQATMATLVGTAALMFGVGAALTGFILVMEDADTRR